MSMFVVKSVVIYCQGYGSIYYLVSVLVCYDEKYCKIIFMCWIFNYVDRTLFEFKFPVISLLNNFCIFFKSSNMSMIVKVRYFIPTKFSYLTVMFALPFSLSMSRYSCSYLWLPFVTSCCWPEHMWTDPVVCSSWGKK